MGSVLGRVAVMMEVAEVESGWYHFAALLRDWQGLTCWEVRSAVGLFVSESCQKNHGELRAGLVIGYAGPSE